ncbi:hypothetical protein RJ639_042728 [Escallonia herrerae]|uniref:Uncharacterized protein n=1 Tax=Escallonia herrerae TaxID=1293975 RepID=A0AA88WBV0_9ASTE|nr:hypothetical protein RJ639_042728 [Escallonia herrerae]
MGVKESFVDIPSPLNSIPSHNGTTQFKIACLDPCEGLTEAIHEHQNYNNNPHEKGHFSLFHAVRVRSKAIVKSHPSFIPTNCKSEGSLLKYLNRNQELKRLEAMQCEVTTLNAHHPRQSSASTCLDPMGVAGHIEGQLGCILVPLASEMNPPFEDRLTERPSLQSIVSMPETVYTPFPNINEIPKPEQATRPCSRRTSISCTSTILQAFQSAFLKGHTGLHPELQQISSRPKVYSPGEGSSALFHDVRFRFNRVSKSHPSFMPEEQGFFPVDEESVSGRNLSV